MAEEQDITSASNISAVKELIAGAGMGLLVGLLIGLAVSEVVGGVIAGLTALLAAFLGLEGLGRKGNGESTTPVPVNRSWRLAGFGIVCALAVLLGMAIRTYNLIGPSPQDQVRAWQSVGYSADEARSLVAYQVLGVVPETWKTVNEKRVTGRTASALFASGDDARCAELEPGRYSNIDEWHNAFILAGGAWQHATQDLGVLDMEQRRETLTAVWRLACARSRGDKE